MNIHPDVVGVIIFIGYYFLLVLLASILSNQTRIHKEVIRKIYHTFFSLSVILVLYVFSRWWISLSVYGCFFILIYFIVARISRTRLFSKLKVLRTEESDQEHKDLQRQILSILSVFSVLIAIFWGLMGPENRHHITSATIIWGIGDAAAAVFGKFFGKRKFNNHVIDRNKTLEGAISFFACAGIIHLFFLIILNRSFSFTFVLISAGLAAVGAALELFSKKGWDNFILPPILATLSWLFWMIPQ